MMMIMGLITEVETKMMMTMGLITEVETKMMMTMGLITLYSDLLLHKSNKTSELFQ
jgi:hypothetical protein